MLTDLSFAEQIINKYTAFGTYRLDEAALVFVKEERRLQPLFAPERKLWFRLYLSLQNYSQSGQKLSINWNLLEQTIAKNFREEIRQASLNGCREEVARLMQGSLREEIRKSFVLDRTIGEIKKKMYQTSTPSGQKSYFQNCLFIFQQSGRHQQESKTVLAQVSRLAETAAWMQSSRWEETTEQIWQKTKQRLYIQKLTAITAVQAQEKRKYIQYGNSLYRNILTELWKELELSSNRIIFNTAENKYTNRIQKKQNELQVFDSISNIFMYRESQPDQAKKAEQKLIRILAEEFYTQNLYLQKMEENEYHTAAAEKAVISILKKTKSLQLLKTAILEPQKEQQKLINQVRTAIGADAAVRLSQYFITRNQVTGQAMSQQMQFFKQDMQRELLSTALSIFQKETMVQEIRPQGTVQLHNLIREKVQIPASKGIRERRLYVQAAARALNRNYLLTAQKSRDIEKMKSRLQQTNATDGFPTMTPQLKKEMIKAEAQQYQNSVLMQNKIEVPSVNETARYVHEMQEQIIYRKKKEVEKKEADTPRIQYEEQTQILKKQGYQEEELEKTKRVVSTLKERMELQEKVIKEIRQMPTAGQKLPPGSIKQITSEVIKTMESELHLEKLRRGLC